MTQKYVTGPAYIRFFARVDTTGECWRWLGAVSADGYGRFSISQRERVYAHRFAYELLRERVPDGLTLDHLCRNTWCVDPEHLEAVTVRENVLRGYGPAGNHARQTHCKHGHPFSEENTRRIGPNHRWRRCITCERRIHREQRRKVAA